MIPSQLFDATADLMAQHPEWDWTRMDVDGTYTDGLLMLTYRPPTIVHRLEWGTIDLWADDAET